MRYDLHFSFNNEQYNSVNVNTRDFEYVIDEDLQDIIEYLYEQRFGIKYVPCAWYLENGANDFVKEIEHQWWHNTLDTITLYKDHSFKDWLKEKYYEHALYKASVETVTDSLKDIEEHYINLCLEFDK